MTAIPRLLHQIWYQGEAAIPPTLRRYREGWARLHPGWETRLWDGASMRALVADRHPDLLPLYDALPRPIYRIDACRYVILQAFGGLYADLDVECFRPVDPLLEGHGLILSRTIGYNNAVIGSAPGHPLWAAALAEIRRSVAAGATATDNAMAVVESVGPRMLTRVIEATGADRAPDTLVCPAHVFEPGTPFLDADGRVRRDGGMARSFACHHMDMRWLPWPQRLLSLVSRRLFSLYWWVRRVGRASAG